MVHALKCFNDEFMRPKEGRPILSMTNSPEPFLQCRSSIVLYSVDLSRSFGAALLSFGRDQPICFPGEPPSTVRLCGLPNLSLCCFLFLIVFPGFVDYRQEAQR